jgi:molybdate transport system permease protein
MTRLLYSWRHAQICPRKRDRQTEPIVVWVLAAAVVVSIHSTAGEPPQTPSGNGTEVVLFAASSTVRVCEQIAQSFKERSGTNVTIYSGSSTALAEQIARGAPADVFLAANYECVTPLLDHGLVRQVAGYLSNRLVVIVRKDHPTQITATDLARDGVRRVALANPESVPAGIYARQALVALDLWDHVRPKLVVAGDVRKAALLVARGEADAGIVYQSDAIRDESVRIATVLDERLHQPVSYPLVLLERATTRLEAVQLYAYFFSDAARTTFQSAGFLPPVALPSAPARPRSGRESTESRAWLLSYVERQAIWLSIRVASVAVLIALPIGIAFGYLLARKEFPGKTALETVLNVTLVLPPVVTGYLLLLLVGNQGLVGRWLVRWFGGSIAFTWWAAVLAAVVVSVPLMVRAIRLAFARVDPRLEQAARSLGARPWDAFFTISLPLARHGVIAGAVLAFARSLGEFGATIMVAGSVPGRTQTIALAVYALADQPGGLADCWRLVLISILLAAAAIAASEVLERRAT